MSPTGIAIVVGMIAACFAFFAGIWFANDARAEELAVAKARMRRLEEENARLRQAKN